MSSDTKAISHDAELWSVTPGNLSQPRNGAAVLRPAGAVALNKRKLAPSTQNNMADHFKKAISEYIQHI